jgi:hypothetical protein
MEHEQSFYVLILLQRNDQVVHANNGELHEIHAFTTFSPVSLLYA